jgi:hypothetical protein
MMNTEIMFDFIKFSLPDILCIWIYLILCFLYGYDMKQSYNVSYSYDINNIYLSSLNIIIK